MSRLFFVTLALTSLAQIGAATTFTFESVANGTAMPFSETVDGLTATITGGGVACNVNLLGFSLQSGRAAISGYCGTGIGDPLQFGVSFSQSLSSVSLNFASLTPDALTLTAFLGAAQIGSTIEASAIGAPFAEGTITFAGGPFDRIQLALAGGPSLSIDNIVATVVPVPVPEPSGITLILVSLLTTGIVKRTRAA